MGEDHALCSQQFRETLAMPWTTWTTGFFHHHLGPQFLGDVQQVRSTFLNLTAPLAISCLLSFASVPFCLYSLELPVD